MEQANRIIAAWLAMKDKFVEPVPLSYNTIEPRVATRLVRTNGKQVFRSFQRRKRSADDCGIAQVISRSEHVHQPA